MKKSLINDYLKALNTLVNDNRVSFSITGNFADKCHIVAYWCKNQVLYNFTLFNDSSIINYDNLINNYLAIMAKHPIKEGDKQLKIKRGKSYEVTIPNKPLEESNIYYNDNDSIFRWELSNNKLYTEIPDILKNLEYFKSGKHEYENIPDKFKKRVIIDCLEIVKKRDSSKYLKIINEDKKKRYVCKRS